MGTSAGGGLSLAVARKVVLGLTPLPKDAIKAVIAIVPVAFHHQSVPEKFRAEYLSYEQNAENVPMIDKKSMDQFFALNNLSPQDKDYFAGNDPEAFKLFPPTYVCTCEFDPLRDDGKVLTKALGEAAVAVKSDHYDGLPHCFWYFPKLPETSQFISKTVSGVKWAIEKM
jgi:versiconal hemiacetal acetate esterase